MRQRFEPRQPEKAAGALDGMDEAEDVAENAALFGSLLEAHEFGVDPVETLAGLGQEFPQQVVHTGRLVAHTRFAGRRSHAPLAARRAERAHLAARRRRLIGPPQCVAKGFNFGCGSTARPRCRRANFPRGPTVSGRQDHLRLRRRPKA